jgi:hypothetical protein
MSTVVIYNIRVNSRERLKRLALHLASSHILIKSLEAPVVVNIRGRYSRQAGELFATDFPRLFLTFLDTPTGWKHDTYTILLPFLNDCKTISWMIEDTYCCHEKYNVKQCLSDINQLSIDFMPFSQLGVKSIYKAAVGDGEQVNSSVICSIYDTGLVADSRFQMISRSLRNGWETYPIWAFGVYSKATFLRLLSHPDDPSQVLTPFGMEVPPPISNFPIRIGFTRKQIFCTFDDDQGFTGSSLMTRGLYSSRYSSSQMRSIEDAYAIGI